VRTNFYIYGWFFFIKKSIRNLLIIRPQQLLINNNYTYIYIFLLYNVIRYIQLYVVLNSNRLLALFRLDYKIIVSARSYFPLMPFHLHLKYALSCKFQ
jgi:hypothetical protein